MVRPFVSFHRGLMSARTIEKPTRHGGAANRTPRYEPTISTGDSNKQPGPKSKLTLSRHASNAPSSQMSVLCLSGKAFVPQEAGNVALLNTSMVRAIELPHLVFFLSRSLRPTISTLFSGPFCKLSETVAIFVATNFPCRTQCVVPAYFPFMACPCAGFLQGREGPIWSTWGRGALPSNSTETGLPFFSKCMISHCVKARDVQGTANLSWRGETLAGHVPAPALTRNEQ
ncbi:hypothetical protein LZ30DRAFT_16211 [Colletotrichum cereale]|nr:hypothetical protein LZ30DRAFT_16211 [Colletotrichum cereale]